MNPYYQDDSVTIYHGDSRELMNELLGMVDVMVTDPPYGVGFTGKRAKQRGGGVTKRNGSYVFADTPELIRDVIVPLIEDALESVIAAAVTPGTRCLSLYPKPKDIGCFFSAASTGMGSWGFTCMQPILFYGSDPYLRRGLGSRANSFGQTYPNDANDFAHPCAKPIRQWSWLVNRASVEGETILDPFMGSGTTLRAAKDLGRKAIGIEIEEKYCEIAAKRMSQEVLDFPAIRGEKYGVKGEKE